MDLQLGFVAGNHGANLQHVALQAGAAVTGKIKGIVLQERAALGQALGHYPQGALQAGRLPISLCPKTDAFLHQTLAGKAGNLVKATEVGGVNIGVAQVVKIGGEGGSALILEDTADGNLGLGAIMHLFPIYLRARLVYLDGVELLVLFHKVIGLLVRHFFIVLHEGAHGIVVHVVTQALLKLYAVSVSDGHVVHVHAEHKAADLLCIGNGCGHAAPHGNPLLGLGVLPIAADHFAGHAHAGANMAELNVSVGALVKVHEVHVYGVPGNLRIVLGVEVKQGLLQGLEALDPHFCGREGVHPGYDAGALGLIVGRLHNGLHFLGGIGRTFIDNLHGNVTGGIEAFHHFPGVAVHFYHGVATVEQLRSGNPP